MNRVFLAGKVISAIEMSTTKNNIKISRFGLQVKQDQDLQAIHNVVFFGKSAEAVQDLKKGQFVFVDGKISKNTYKDKMGVEKTSVNIIGQAFQVIESEANTTTKSEGNGSKLDMMADFDDSDFPFQ